MPGTIPAARQHLIDAIAMRRARHRPAAAGARRLRARRTTAASARTTCGSAAPRRSPAAATAPRVRLVTAAGAAARARLQPRRGAGRLAIAAHDRRGRHRRHAVPRRFARHGAERRGPRDPADGAPGAARAARRPRPAAAASARTAIRRTAESWQHIAVDRASASRAARGTAQRGSSHARRRARRGRGLAEDARARHRDRADLSAGVPGVSRADASRSERIPRVAGGQPLHVPRLPRVPARARPARDRLVPVPRSGLGLLRTGGGGRSRNRRILTGETAAQGARARAADRHQGELGLDRASRDLSRLHRRQDVRYARPRHRRAPLHRPVHLDHLQHEPARDPAAAPQGAARRGRFGVSPASHDGKALMHVLETYPRDELFQASVRNWCGRRAASSTCTSGGACACSCAATRTSASSRACSTCRATATTRRRANASKRILLEELARHRPRVAGADLRIRRSRACTCSCAPTPSATVTADVERIETRITERCAPGATSCARSSRTAARPTGAEALAGSDSPSAFPAAYQEDVGAERRDRRHRRARGAARAGRPRSACSCARATRRAARCTCGSIAAAIRSRCRTCCRCSRTSTCAS